jgi:hypothetical protein
MQKKTRNNLCFVIVLAFAVMLAAPVCALAAEAPQVRIDGEFVQFSANDQRPVIVDGRTLVPLRAVMETLGFWVAWDEDRQTAKFVNPRHYILIGIGNDYIFVDGDDVPLDTPARIINGRVMIPLRAINEAIGFEVKWDNATRIADITTPDTFRPKPVPRPDYLPAHLPQHVSGSITLHNENYFESYVDLSEPMRFRYIFYDLPLWFMELTKDREWVSLPTDEYVDMQMVYFIQGYNIQREDFDAAVERIREIYKSMATSGFAPIGLDDELFELPNADIIYTFDNDIINYFYRRV